MHIHFGFLLFHREENRQAEIKQLVSSGTIPSPGFIHGNASVETDGYPMGQVAAMINEILPAKTIVENMVEQAAEILSAGAAMVKARPMPKL